MWWIAAKAAFATGWSRLTSPMGLKVAALVAVLLAVSLAALGIYRAGENHQKAVYAKLTAKAVQKVAKVEKAGAAISADVGAKNDQRQVEIRTITKTLIKEVPYAVLSDPDRPSLSNGFVRLHDSAATGVPILPDPAGRPDAAPSGVTDPQLAETLIENYGTCLANAQTVKAWQDWQTRQAKLWASEVKAPTP